ncbi:MAG: isopentenyl-diphosphate delta-isomerase, partial [Lachnospiraceae bacterium]|nr:isopentenyl-diphosphate delta-isomerase [Lachnospiraceae bacterium]
ALGQIIKYMKLHSFDEKTTLGQAVERLYEKIETEEFAAFCDGGISGNMVIPRKQEIYETLNRCRRLLDIV